MTPNAGKMPRGNRSMFVRWSWDGRRDGPFDPSQWKTFNWQRGGLNDVDSYEWVGEVSRRDGRQANGSYE